MGRKIITILALIILVSATAAHCAEEDERIRGNVGGFIGFKALDEDDWEPIEGQFQFGTLFDITPPGWPVSLAADLMLSTGYEEDEIVNGLLADIEGSTLEIDLGVRKIFMAGGGFRPYIGAGLSFISAWYEIDYVSIPSVDDDDSGAGVWLGGGFYGDVSNHVYVGCDIRYSTAEVELFGEDKDAGGFQLGATVGYHW